MIFAGIILPAGIMLLLFSARALAWTNAAPNEAIFFDDPDFQGPSLIVRLEPGMRQALKPALGALDNKISSMIVGENVKVLVFTDPAFRGAVRMYDYTIADHMPDNNQISSLIVCPKDVAPQGVLFIQKRISEIKTSSKRPWHYITGKGIFFPLPESAGESEAKFPLVAPDWDKVRYVYVSPGVEAEIFSGPDFKGRSLSLPCADCGPQTVFDLQSFGFYDARKPLGVIPSLSVKAQGKN
jgi:hypothetical protein